MAGRNASQLARPELIIFDLGGVIIDIDFSRVFQHWARLTGQDAQQIQQRFAVDDAYRQHERGELTTTQYLDYQRDLHNLSLSDEQMLAGWNAIFGPEIPGVRALIQQAASIAPCVVFSNTNAGHQAYWAPVLTETLNLFEHVFVSNELGLRKPDADAFLAVCNPMDVAPEQSLFFDDTQENLDGADALGISAVKVSSPADIKRCLDELSKASGAQA
ncbi:MAG: HAD-IA family hydrolase [Burkholderiaceae bacterium]